MSAIPTYYLQRSNMNHCFMLTIITYLYFIRSYLLHILYMYVHLRLDNALQTMTPVENRPKFVYTDGGECKLENYYDSKINDYC